MFSKLRNKIMLLYTLSVFLILFFSFCLIEYNTYQRTFMEITRKLNDIPTNPEFNIPKIQHGVSDGYIYLYQDNGTFKEGFSIYNLSDEEYTEILKNILETDKKIINYDSKYYAVKRTAFAVKLVSIDHEINYLLSLGFTLLFYLTIFSVISFILSYIFAWKFIKPIEKSYIRQTEFISDVSHELKTPLAVIFSNLQLFNSENENLNLSLTTIAIEESKRLKNLTSNLLTLSKTNFEQNNFIFSKINLSDSLYYLLRAFEVKLFEENFIFTSEIDDDIWIVGNEDLIQQLLVILIDNAIKYNTSQKKIDITMTVKKDYVYLYFMNDSEKISDSEIHLLFNRFYRKDKSRNTEGFGLGLSLAQLIIKQHNGTISTSYINGQMVFKIKFNVVSPPSYNTK